MEKRKRSLKISIEVLILLMSLSACGQSTNSSDEQKDGNQENNQALVVRQEVSFGLADWPLKGELVKPTTGDDVPLLIMVHGSGPNDRDETIGPNRPFKDIADYLATQGIASLRYDKRTFTYGGKVGAMKSLTVKQEVVDDVVEAIDYAKQLDGISRIFVLGHSMGGYLMPRVAGRSDVPAGYILANANMSSLGQLIPRQIAFLVGDSAKLQGKQKQQIEQLLSDSDKSLRPEIIEEGEMVMGAHKAYWQDLKDYRPIDELKTIKHPVLAIYCGMDYQVDSQEYQLFKQELGNQANINLQFFEGDNHLMMPSKVKGPKEYNEAGQVDTAIMEAIGQFIHQN